MLNEQSLVRAFKTLIVDKLAEIVDLIVVGSTLEPATALKLGGVKIGSGINVTEDGTISTSGDWIYKGLYTGNSGDVSLPDNWKELLLIQDVPSGNSNCSTLYIIKDMFTHGTGASNNKFILATGGKTADGKELGATFEYNKTNNTIKQIRSYVADSGYTTSGEYLIYYK